MALGIAFVAMWSSAFTSARIVVAYAPPFLALFVRFLISGVVALAIGRALGQRIRLSRAEWRAVVIFGVCQNALYLGLNFEAMRTIAEKIRIVQGDRDRVSLAHYAEAAARLNPRAALSRYENIGHSPFFEAPERFNLELLSFVRGCETGRAKAS